MAGAAVLVGQWLWRRWSEDRAASDSDDVPPLESPTDSEYSWTPRSAPASSDEDDSGELPQIQFREDTSVLNSISSVGGCIVQSDQIPVFLQDAAFYVPRVRPEARKRQDHKEDHKEDQKEDRVASCLRASINPGMTPCVQLTDTNMSARHRKIAQMYAEGLVD